MAKSSSVTAVGHKQAGAELVHYQLDEQIGYLLRLANQRHLEIYSRVLSDLTPTQFSLLYRLTEVDALSQNELGRRVGMDAATTNGVIERLARKNLIVSRADPSDKRRRLISLTRDGRRVTKDAVGRASQISEQTLSPLSQSEASTLVRLLKKISCDTLDG